VQIIFFFSNLIYLRAADLRGDAHRRAGSGGDGHRLDHQPVAELDHELDRAAAVGVGRGDGGVWCFFFWKKTQRPDIIYIV
jgi:hypothetical protein